MRNSKSVSSAAHEGLRGRKQRRAEQAAEIDAALDSIRSLSSALQLNGEDDALEEVRAQSLELRTRDGEEQVQAKFLRPIE